MHPKQNTYPDVASAAGFLILLRQSLQKLATFNALRLLLPTYYGLFSGGEIYSEYPEWPL